MAALEEARANSMRIYFGPGKKEPMESEIFDFMKNKMRLSSDSLMSMYKESRESCVYIKFKTDAQLKTSLRNLPSSMEFHYNKYESTTVTFSAASTQFKYVRIFNLPPEINDQEISQVMSKYGVIQRMVRERYGPETGYPIWSSVRGVHMEIKQEIPSTIHVRNFQARVFYDGLQNKCFLCGSRDHMKVNCPKRASVSQRLDQNTEPTYSAVTARPERWLGRPSARKAEEAKEGQGQMTVLNNLFATKPTTSGDNTIATEVVPTLAEVRRGSSNQAAQCSSADVTSEFSGGMEIVVAATENTERNSLAASKLSDVADTAMMPEKTIGEEEEGFQLVQYGKSKKVSSTTPATGEVAQSKKLIPPANISVAQSTRSRTRSRQDSSKDKRSRSRSRLSLGKSSQEIDGVGDVGERAEGDEGVGGVGGLGGGENGVL